MAWPMSTARRAFSAPYHTRCGLQWSHQHHNRRKQTTMTYITMYGRVESVDDASYDREPKKAGEKKEHIERYQVTISIPKCAEFFKFDCTPGTTDMPKVADMEAWEDNPTMIVCEADGCRTVKGETD